MQDVKILHLLEVIKLKEIKRLRESHGISQEQLAKMLHVDRSTVAKWETNDGYPRGGKLAELASVLHCTIDELYGRGKDSM